jgi:hypothetical protein|tara:strand:+ start:11388 stop:11663 length:276 start_codon:yes stop_codon:yes gene_type:complete
MTAWLAAGLVSIVICLFFLKAYGMAKERLGRSNASREALQDNLKVLDEALEELSAPTPSRSDIVARWLRRNKAHTDSSNTTMPDTDDGGNQ